MTNNIRRQLSLFIDPKDAETIEQVRREFNPKQFEIIKAHVTLCREDEIQDLEKVKSNLLLLTQAAFNIKFEKISRFDQGKGLFIPAITNNEEFDKLRRQVLTGLIDNPRKHTPHITLMHSRNSTCTDLIFETICNLKFPNKLDFNKISLIEQAFDGKWRLLQEYELNKKI